MAGVRHLLERLDPDPNVRGHQFEQICRWFLTNDPIYRRLLRHVWLWDEWPDRTGRDIGIDLVAEAHNGDLWAIQAKAYEQNYWLTKKDVDSFLSASSRREFAYRLLVATTDRIGVNARTTLSTQEKGVGLALLADLERSAVDWPASPRRLEARSPKPKKPAEQARLKSGKQLRPPVFVMGRLLPDTEIDTLQDLIRFTLTQERDERARCEEVLLLDLAAGGFHVPQVAVHFVEEGDCA